MTANRQRSGHKVWRLAPSSDAEADTLAAFVAERWAGEAFGIVDDGSTYARDLADEVRARLGARPVEPALVDNYRPADDRQFAVARRIQDSGVTRLVLLGTRRDTAIVARDAAELGLDLEIVGGESLIDEPAPDVDIPAGVRAAGIYDPPAAEGQLLREGYRRPAAAAASIALTAVEEARASGRAVDEILSSRTFETTLGPIMFDATGNADWNAFGILEYDGTRFTPTPQT